MQSLNVTKESNGNKVGYPELINVYYTALMIFLVFTAGNNLFKGLSGGINCELVLYVLLWVSMVIQTTFAYKHIKEIHPKKYNKLAFLSDSLDICIFIYVCATIGKTCTADEFKDMDTYRHISIPFLILSVNQFLWYINVREGKQMTVAAIFRLCLLFVVMLTTTILDETYHNVWMLAIIAVGNFGIMVILRSMNNAPTFFENMLDQCWKILKKNSVVRKLFDKLSAPKEEGSFEEMIITIEEN